GTFPLPEAQLDRFMFKLSIGYPDADAEEELMLANYLTEAVTRLEAVTSSEEIIQLQDWAKGVTMGRPVMRYIIDLVQATRTDPALLIGASPRASLSLMRAARV